MMEIRSRKKDDEFWKKLSANKTRLELTFRIWKPTGDQLIKKLREAADALDSSRYWSNIGTGLGGLTTLGGIAMMLFPATMPVGAVMSAGGAVTSIGSSAANSVKTSTVQSFINEMMDCAQSGYQEMLHAAEDFCKMIEAMPAFLEVSEDDKDTKISEKGQTLGVNTAGRCVKLAADSVRLSKVAPYLQYAGMSHKAMKAAMIKDAVNVAQVAKMSGTAGAAGRAAEIRKATQAFKVAKEGAKLGAVGLAWAAFGTVLAVVDIHNSVKDLQGGSIAPNSKEYRATADKIQNMMSSVEDLL